MSEKVTPGDGSCMFHAILDQIQRIPELQDYASSHFELRYKIVSDGYKMFLETEKLSWPDEGEDICTKKEWKTDMLDPTTWGDEVVLSLASNLLEHSASQARIQCLESPPSNLWSVPSTRQSIYFNSRSRTSFLGTTRVSFQGVMRTMR